MPAAQALLPTLQTWRTGIVATRGSTYRIYKSEGAILPTVQSLTLVSATLLRNLACVPWNLPIAWRVSTGYSDT